MQTEAISEDAIFKVGHVIAVRGRSIDIKIDKTKNSSHLLYQGKLLRNVAVGGYIKIVKGFTVIIGKIDGEFITEDRYYRDKYYGRENDRMNRVVNVSLLGFFNGEKFERGVKELPLLDNECYLLHLWEFNQVHDFIRPGDQPLGIGNLALEKGQEIKVGVNSLFASHIGIFGNTGSGKSYTLAKIYRELFLMYQDKPRFREKSKFVLIDFNGEYAGDEHHPDIIVEANRKTSYRLSTTTPRDRLRLSPAFISSPEFWVVFLEATEKTQAPFLKKAIESPYTERRLESEESLQGLIRDLLRYALVEHGRDVIKSDVTNLLMQIGACLPANNTARNLANDYRANLQYNATLKTFYYKEVGQETTIYHDKPAFTEQCINAKVNSLTLPVGEIELIDRIRLKIAIQFFIDVVRGYSNREHLLPLISRMDKRIDSLKNIITITERPEEKNLIVISLKDVDIHMKKVVPLLISKQLYDAKKETNDPSAYLNIIIDEAHNILSERSERESEQWKDYRLENFEEIIKEGRKFGVFLTIASQRPADISQTIISQLHNYFLHRLINHEDIKAVEKTISYLDRLSFDSLPILPTGTCIMAGLGANVPVVIDIGRIPPQNEPYSKTQTLADKWAANPRPEELATDLL